jgi:hypothetical protein
VVHLFDTIACASIRRTMHRGLPRPTTVGVVAIRETVSRLVALPLEINFRKVRLPVCLVHDAACVAKADQGGNLVEGAQAPSPRREPKARRLTVSRRFSPPQM